VNAPSPTDQAVELDAERRGRKPTELPL